MRSFGNFGPTTRVYDNEFLGYLRSAHPDLGGHKTLSNRDLPRCEGFIALQSGQ